MQNQCNTKPNRGHIFRPLNYFLYCCLGRVYFFVGPQQLEFDPKIRQVTKRMVANTWLQCWEITGGWPTAPHHLWWWEPNCELFCCVRCVCFEDFLLHDSQLFKFLIKCFWNKLPQRRMKHTPFCVMMKASMYTHLV